MRLTALVVLMLAGLSGMFASSPAFASDPPGDCWQGALADDPLHCQVLEAAQRDGTVEVDGIFRASNDELYVYLSKPKPAADAPIMDMSQPRVGDAKRIDRATSDLLKAKAAKFVAQSPDSFNYDHRVVQWCVFATEEMGREFDYDVVIPYAEADDALKAKYRECMLSLVPWSSQWQSMGPNYFGNVILLLAPAEAQRQIIGWASWTRLWPRDSSGLVREALDFTGPFDVSEVDTENIPAPCEVRPTFHYCMWKEQFPHLDIVSVHGYNNALSKAHFLIANPPAGEAETFAKEEIAAQTAWTSDQIVFVPVRHTFEEQWRAEIILTRFAKSSGNTLGITKASMSSNWSTSDEDVFVNGYQESTELPGGGKDHTTWQAIVALEAPDAQLVADALPQLLAQLGIPPTTVGIVRDTDRAENRNGGGALGPAIDTEDVVDIARENITDTVDENRSWVIAAGASVAILILAGGSTLAFRRVRRLRNEPSRQRSRI